MATTDNIFPSITFVVDFDGANKVHNLANLIELTNFSSLGFNASVKLNNLKDGDTFTLYGSEARAVKKLMDQGYLPQLEISTSNLFSCSPAHFDYTFGTQGVSEPVHSSIFFDSVVQSDGKIIAVGQYNSVNIVIARFNIDGTLDTDFNSVGFATLSINDDENALSVKIDGDGKYVVGGRTDPGANNQALLVRYNTDGSLDTTFGSPNGYVVYTLTANDDAINDIVIQPDGKIVAVGRHDATDVLVMRVLSDGTLDTTFGTGGVTNFAPVGTDDQAYGVTLDGGYVVLTGYSDDGGGNLLALIARFTSAGALDTAGFNSGGTGGYRIETINGISDIGRDIKVDINGNYLVGGDTETVASPANTFDPFLMVVETDGDNLLATFGTAGVEQTSVPGEAVTVSSIVTDSQGNIYTYGSVDSTGFLYLDEHDVDGNLVAAFGSNLIEIGINGSNAAGGISLVSESKLLVGAGLSGKGHALSFCA